MFLSCYLLYHTSVIGVVFLAPIMANNLAHIYIPRSPSQAHKFLQKGIEGVYDGAKGNVVASLAGARPQLMISNKKDFYG